MILKLKRYHPKPVLYLILILLPLVGLSQARLNFDNGTYLTMGGGSSSTPLYLVIENGNSNAISRNTSGHIISENEFNLIKWKTTSTGIYEIPLGKGTTDYFPFYFNKTTNGFCPGNCYYLVSSWFTLNNATLPTGVTNMNPSEDSAIDRFWLLNLSGYTTNPTTTIRFYYLASELDAISEADLQAQRWVSTLWELPPGGTVNTVNDYVEVSGATQFSNPWTLVNSSDPLPIELIRFSASWKDAEQTAVLLKWSTATETNNDYFNIEWSMDASNWSTIGRIPGAGNSSRFLEYDFLHIMEESHVIQSTFIYYRLKQTDYDGQFAYSPIVSLLREAKGYLTVFPNPVIETLFIQLKSDIDSKGEIFLLNGLQQVVLQKPVDVFEGENQYALEVSGLSKGIYILKLSVKDRLITTKVLIEE